MLLRRFVVSLMITLAILPALSVATPAKAQINDEATYDSLIAQVDGVPPAAGPLEGELALNGEEPSEASLGISLADVLIQVDFEVPDVTSDITWVANVAFRQSGPNFHYLAVWPDGTWSFAPAGGGAVSTGEGFTVGAPGSLVRVVIAAVEETAYIGTDSGYIATLEAGRVLDPGDVIIGGNIIGVPSPELQSIGYVGFSAWDLAGSMIPAEAPATAVADAPATEATTAPPPVATPEPTSESTQAAAFETSVPEAPPSQAPAGDDAAIFNSYLQQSLTSPVLFGPTNDRIVHLPDAVSFFSTGIQPTDFIARVECVAEISAADGFWDCGFVFRGGGSHYRVAYVSDGYWFFSEGSAAPLASGTDGPVSATAGSKVVLNLIAVGDAGYFGINDQFVTRLDLSSIPDPGPVDLASAFFSDTYTPGGGVTFEDLVIWSLDQGTVEPAPTEVVGAPSATPGEEIAAGDEPLGVTGNSYTSPTYGYSLTWPDGWTIESSETQEGSDYLGLSNGPVLADLIGESFDPATGTCFDRLLSYYEENPSYSDVQMAADATSALPGVWEITGILTMTHTNSEGASTDYVNYAACSAIPGQSAIVSLEQFVPITEFRNNVDAMDQLRAGFAMSGGVGSVATSTTVEPTPTTGIVEPTPTTGVVEPTPATGIVDPTATPEGVSAQTPVGQSSVVGNTYTSPTFGYSITWDDSWSVIAEQSEEGVDFLRIGGETLTADLYAAVGSNPPAACLDELLNYYVNDELYADAQFVTDASGAPMMTDAGTHATALISYTRTEPDGSTIEQFSYATCFRMEQQGAVVVLEVYMAPADFVLQGSAISALQQGLVIPGLEGIEIAGTGEQTPVAGTGTEGSTEGGTTTVSPPELDTAQTATFILSPVNNSGVQGTGTLEAQTRLVIVTAIVIGGAPGDTVTVQRGTCDALTAGAEPDYIVGELDESGLLRDELRVRLAALVGGEPYSVVVYAAGDDFSQVLACGPIG